VQPTEEELRKLQDAGFKSVINMRCEHEDGFLKNEKELVTAQVRILNNITLFEHETLK